MNPPIELLRMLVHVGSERFDENKQTVTNTKRLINIIILTLKPMKSMRYVCGYCMDKHSVVSTVARKNDCPVCD